MPKWDKTRNYYADLELPPSASSDDIKKQFKKLALKYHPDRNPGREAEVNGKFQIIQSAHEILTDDTLRRQYDDARKPSSRFPTASGVKGNPWSEVGKQYAPPPTRRAANNQNRPTSGAHRYENFTGGVPRTSRMPPKDDSQFRRSNADAWDNIRPSSSRRPPPPPPNSARPPPSPAGRPPPGRAPTSATRNSRPSNPTTSMPQTAYQKQKAQASFGAHRKAGFVPRSANIADEPPVTNKNYTTHRTHSYMYTEPEEVSPRGSPPAQDIPPVADPLAQFRDKLADDRQSTPYATPGGEKTSLFDGYNGFPGLGRSTSVRTPEMPGAFPRARPRASSTPKSSSNDGGSEESVKVNTGNDQSRANARYHPTAAAGGPTQKTSTAQAPMPSTDSAGDIPMRPSVFSFGRATNSSGHVDSSGDAARSFARNSTENINTNFVDHDGLDDWEFKAGSASANEDATAARTRQSSRSRPTRRPTPLTRSSTQSRMPSMQEAADATDTQQPFLAEKWNEQIGSQHFEPQVTSTSSSPTRRSNSKRAKSVKMTAGTAGVVDEDDDSAEEAEASRPSFSMPEAMDIDTPPPEKTTADPLTFQHEKYARNIPIEPHREDWRAGNANGFTSEPIDRASNGNSSKAAFPSQNASANSSKVPLNGTKTTIPPQHVGSEDAEEFNTTFSDFRKVEPFADSPHGLDSFADIKSSLPFQSKPSENIPLDIQSPRPLEFPLVPVAPRLPSTVGVANTRSLFRKYAQDFYNYVDKWESFQMRVQMDLQTRHEECMQFRLRRGRNWLDSSDLAGDGARNYLLEIEQVQAVHQTMAEALAEHRKRVAEFMSFRDRVN